MKTKILAVILCLVALVCVVTLVACDEESDCTHASKQWVEEVSASCTTDGTVGHYVCPDCHEKLDADGKTITDLTVKAAHSPKNEWSVADGKHYHACENCDAKLDEASCSGGEATCTEKATCSVCQNQYGPEPSHKPVSAWSVADGKHYHACENCDTKLDEASCSGGTATCTKKAECSVCYSQYGDFGDCVYNIPDHDENHHWMKCECGEKGTLHVHQYTSFEVTPPTCTEGGFTTYACDCGHTYQDDETDPAKHKYSEKWEYDGSHHWHEAICGCENEISDYTKHTLTAIVTNPTCTAQGFTVYTCGCGYKSAPTDFVPATGHSVSQWSETNSVLFDAKKCEYTVYYSGECSTCGGTDTKTQQMEKHSEYVRITTPATCKTEGVKSWFCSSEDCVHHNVALDTQNYTDTTAHVWEINNKNSNGKMTVYKCRDCNATKTQSNGNSADISSDDLEDMSEIELSDSKSGSDQNIVIGIDTEIKKNLSGKDVSISAGTLDDGEKQNAMNQSNLDEEQRKRLEGCTIYDFTLSTSEQISKLGGWATIRIPYILQSGDNPNSIIVWYINNGKLEAIEAVYAEDANGKGYVTFQTDHFSYYTVAQIDPADICKQLDKHDATQLHVIAPTCTTGGYTVCLRCGEQVEGSAVPALGHTLNAEVLTEATCTEAGLVHYTCANCDLTYDAAIPAIGHYHVLTEQITATCQTVGSTTYACVHCSDSYTMTTPKLSHIYHTIVVEPTCETNGYTEKTCTQCGNVVKAAYVAAVGHVESTVWYQDQNGHYHVCVTCGEKMSEAEHTPGVAATETTAQICTVCEYTIAPPVQHVHVLTKVERVQETCTKSGNIEYYTCACGTWFADADAQMLISDHASVIVDAMGHTVESTPYEEPTCEEVGYTAGVWCSVCETYLRGHVMISAYGHDYHQSVKAPTCTEQGSITYQCAHCLDTEGMQGESIEALGHNLTATIKAPTCTENGYTTYFCTRCDYHTTENEKAALGHNYSSTYLFNEEGHYHACIRCDAATEMETHIADYPEATEMHGINCVKCNYKIAEAMEHTHASQKAIAAIVPTCETSGNIAYYICSCGEWFADEACTVMIYNHSGVILQPMGHKLAYHAEQKATCTEKGYTAGIRCETCLTWQNGHEEIAPIGHSFLNQFEYDDEGHRQLCQSCGAPSETAPHTHFISVTKPTCTTEGYTTYSCPCGHTYTDDKVAALDHAFGQWMPMANGQHMRICGNDASHVDIDDCAYSSDVVAPTCEKNGYTQHTCQTCGYSYQSDKTDALGHDFGEWTYDGKDGHVRVCKNDPSHSESGACIKNVDVHKPTCTEGGYTEYSCEICKHSYQDHVVPELGHRYEGGRCERCGEIDEKVVYQYRKEYTTENGMTVMEEYLFCPDGTVGVYSYKIADGQSTLMVWGISYWNVENQFVFVYGDKAYTQPEACYTVDKNGTLTEYVCEKHEYIQQSYESATCTEDGYLTVVCKYCGDLSHTVYPALQHDFSKWHSDRNGGHYRYCYHDKSHMETGKCEYTEQIVPPTCEMDGYTKHICTICEGYYEDTYVPAVDHEYHWTPWYSGQHQGTCVYDESHTVFEICVYKDGMCLVCGQTVSDKNIVEKAQYTEVSADETEVSTSLYTFYDNGVVGIEHSDGTVSSMYWNKDGKYFRLYEDLNLDTSFVGSAVITDQGELVFCVCEDGKHGDVSIVEMEHPSCTENGYRITQCMICGEQFTNVLPARGHDWTEWQPMYDDINQPSKQHTRWCQYDMSHREIADCHYVSKVIAPTCTEGGYTLYKCECGSHYMTDETSAHGHSFVDGRCEYCGKSEFPEVVYSFAGQITSADGTYYEEIFCYDIYTVVLKRYTVSENDEKIFVEEKSMYWSLANKNTLLMLFMDETYNDSYYSFDLSKDGTLTPHVCEKHSYKILVGQKNATCEEDGYRVYRCYFCHVTLTKADPALGHAYGEWTSIDKGMHAQICANDASHVITEACQYTHDHKDPTCIKGGYSKDICVLCHTEVNAQYYPATGHSFTDGICQTCGGWEPVDENDVLDGEYRATMIQKATDYWNNLMKHYTVSVENREAYNQICQAMRNAISKAELNQYYRDFEVLMANIQRESVSDEFRSDILQQMNSTWRKLQEQGLTISVEKQKHFDQLYASVKKATSNDEIQSCYEKFNDLVLQIEKENQGGDETVDEKLRQQTLSGMSMQWANIMAQNAATAEQQMRYDQLYADVSVATSNDEIQNLYAEFQELVWQIENGQLPDGSIDEAYRKELLNSMRQRWKEVLENYTVSEDSALYAEQLITKVQNAIMMEELNWANDEFWRLVNDIENENSEKPTVDEAYRKDILNEMWRRWNNYMEKYGSTEVDQKNLDHWIGCVEGATSNEQIDKYFVEFENWMSKLEKDNEENRDYVEDIRVDQYRFTATEGMDVQQFIMDHIVGMNLYIQYSQSGVKTIPVTYEMVVWEQDVSVFETVGNYFFWIEYEENGNRCSVGITVIVQPDMGNANLLGEYTIAGALVGSSEDWILRLYDKGLAVMAMPGLPETQQFLTYTLDGTLLCLDSNGMIMVMQLNEETHEAEMYYPTEPLIGTYYYYDVMFQVYGTYTGAGDYITVMTYMISDGMPVQTTTYVTLDLENRTMTSMMFGGQMSFDENGNLGCNHYECAVSRQDPTCTESGFENVYCMNCGESWYRELPALGHAINESGVCENCGMSVGIVVPDKDYTDRYLCRMENVWYPLVENYGWEFFENYRIDTERFDEFQMSIMKAESKEEAQYFYTLFLEWIDRIHREYPDEDLWATRRELLDQMEWQWMILNDECGEFIREDHIVWYENIQDMMYATNDWEFLVSLYKDDFCMLMQEVRDFASDREDCVQDLYLEQNRFELTEGHGYDIQTFIEKYVLGTRVYVLYEQAGVMEFPITWDMISYEMTDIDRVGEYYFEIHFSIDGFDAQLGIRLVVRVDMSKANVLGSYACDMSCIGENVILHMEIYDNGYAVVTVEGDEGQDIFPCRIENGMIYLELGTGVFVMQIDDENTAHMYVPSEETPMVGAYQYSFLLFNVYGPYTGAGKYVAVITMLNGNPSWMTQMVYLDLENAVFECTMLGGQLTFDENGILMCRHEFEGHTQEPTCTEYGFVDEYCIHCGIGNFAEIPPLGHSYVNGICENCGYMEENELQHTVEKMLQEMEWQWNSLWNDYGEMNPSMLVAYQKEYDARYASVKQSTSAEEAQTHFDAYIDMIEKIRDQLGEPTNGETERTRQEFLNNMEAEWNRLQREVGEKVIGAYWGRYYELVNRMNFASDTDTMNHIFYNEFQWLKDEIREVAANQDSFISAYLEQRKFELTEGHGYDLERFIAENIIGKHLYIEYSQSGVVAIPITWEMIDWSMEMDISSAGRYAIGVHYNEQNFGTWQSIQIVVWMDMSAATQLGTYSCDLSCMGEEDVMTMEIYDNGYAFVYFNGDAEDRELFPCMTENGVIYLDTGDGIYVMRIDGKYTAHMYEATEEEPIIGIYTYGDEIHIAVYGTYEGAGQYIAKASIMEDDEMFWLSLLVELNLENRTILCEVFSSRPISFDENGNLLDEDSDDEMEGNGGISGDVEAELPMNPMDPDPTPDDSEGYGNIIIIPSEGGMNGDYTYTDTIINGNVAYIPTVGEYVYSAKTVA